MALNPPCERMRSTEHAPRSPLRLLERRHALAQIVERGAVGHAERPTYTHSVGDPATPPSWALSPPN